MLRRLTCVLCCLLPLPLAAQTIAVQSNGTTLYSVPASGFDIITASHLPDSNGNALNGTICFAPVDNSTEPLQGYSIPGYGQVTGNSVCANVVNGAITTAVTSGGSPFVLADSRNTYPANVCFNVTATESSDGGTALGGGTPTRQSGYNCVQMNSTWCTASAGVTTCDLDNYAPSTPALTLSGAPSIVSASATVLPYSSQATATVTALGNGQFSFQFGIPTGPQGATAITGLSGDGAGNATLTGKFKASALSLTDAGGNWLANGETALPSAWTDNLLAGPGTGAAFGTGSSTGTYGTVAIGWQALAAATTCTQCVAIGSQALDAYAGEGGGVEDGQFVAIGSNACGHATDGHEAVCIGHSALGTSTYAPGGVYIGTHNSFSLTQTNTGYNGNTDVGGNQAFLLTSGGNQSTDTIQTANDSLYGYAIWEWDNGATATNFSSSDETIVGNQAGGCWYNTSANTIIGQIAATSTVTGPCPSTLPSGEHNIIISSGQTAGDGLPNAPGSSITTASSNVLIGTKGSGIGSHNAATGGLITTANAVNAVGGGALAQTTTANDSDAFGDFCGYAEATNETDCFGYGSSIAETGPQVSAFGFEANDRNSSTLGYVTAVGYRSMFSTSGTGAEQYDTFVGADTNCNGCTNSVGVGYNAQVGAVDSAVQLGPGTDSTASTLQFLNLPVATKASFSVSGCTANTLVGSGLSGSFKAGATSCTPVVTTGVTAPHGYSCTAHDQASPTTVVGEASSTTTTVTFPAMTVAIGDIVSLKCTPN